MHLVLDTSLAGDHVDVRAYASRALSLGDKALATEFVELPCEVLMGEAERVGRECRRGGAGRGGAGRGAGRARGGLLLVQAGRLLWGEPQEVVRIRHPRV